MKLDRNINPDGTGKYALLHLRKLRQYGHRQDVIDAINVLSGFGLLHFGNEGAGEQFFVMKYKDKFVAPALFAYSRAAMDESQTLALSLLDPPKEDEDRVSRIDTCRSLQKYSSEMHAEALLAQRQGTRIPD